MEDQLGVDRNSKTKKEDGSDLGKTRPQVTSVGDRLASTGGVVQLILQTLGSGPTPPVFLRGSSRHKDFPLVHLGLQQTATQDERLYTERDKSLSH